MGATAFVRGRGGPGVAAFRKKEPRVKGAVRTVVDGIAFPSKHEARRYSELRLLERAGHVVDVTMQVWFPIVLQQHITLATPPQTHGQPVTVLFDGWSAVQLGLVHVAHYVADFTYYDAKTGEFIVEDAKGVKTDIYKLKKRLIEAQYGFVIREV